MQKLIKISTSHYIVVDDSEIKESDWCYNIAHKLIVKPTDIEWANLNSDNLKKITHSTQSMHHGVVRQGEITGVKAIFLSEVEEAINGYSVEKMAPTKYCIPHKHYISSDDKLCYETGFKDGFKAHQELVKDKFSLEEINAALVELAKPQYKLDTKTTFKDLLYMQRKTEWDVEFIDGKIKLV